MAKAVEKKEKKAKAPDFKDQIYDVVGNAIAAGFGEDAFRIKVEGMTECVIFTNKGIDYTIAITQKKNNVDYEDDHVKASYLAGETVVEA